MPDPRTMFLLVAAQRADADRLISILGSPDNIRYTTPERALDCSGQVDACVWVRRDPDEILTLPPQIPVIVVGEAVEGVETIGWGQLRATVIAQALGRAVGRSCPPDPVTGLPSRQRFFNHAETTLELLRNAVHPPQAAVILLDVDDFATVNDSLGHRSGDRVLSTLTERLSEVLRRYDLLARVGADEFAILLVGDDIREVADTVADRLSAAMARPVILDSQELYPSASFGIAISEDCSIEAGTLMRSADIALRKAKQQGRGGRVRFLRTMHDEIRARLELEGDIQRALLRNEFILYYQPVVSASSGAVVSFEALVRWPHPTRGLISPGHFLPLAEQTGLILPLSWQLLTRACREAVAWGGDEAPSVSVNLAAAQLVSPELIPRLRAALKDSGLSPARLKLEITESCLIDERRLSPSLFEELGDMGLHVHLDDFGTGYSSLSYLERFPLHGLKIDRSFVQRLLQDDRRRAITRRLIDLGRDLQMTVIAEGVETIEELLCLQDMRCELIQGYYYAKPMPPSEIADFLGRNKRKVS